MRRMLILVFLAMGTRPTEAAVPNLGHLYTLEESSDFQEGCFYLCECPIVERNDLQGRFILIPLGAENGYEVFSVIDLVWTVGADFIGSPIEIHGSGTYRTSTSAQSQELVLDLEVGDHKIERYDSGLVPVAVPFPAIDVVVLTYPYGCYDTVIQVSAVPANQGPRPPRLQYEQNGPNLGASTTWGRLKKFWVD